MTSWIVRWIWTGSGRGGMTNSIRCLFSIVELVFLSFVSNSTLLYCDYLTMHFQFSIIFQIGYRDGLIAGKEASAQEGFNIGFKQSVLDGYSWGVVRGVTRYS